MPETEVTTLNEQLSQDLPSTAENETTGLAGSCWQPARQEQDSKVRSLAFSISEHFIGQHKSLSLSGQ